MLPVRVLTFGGAPTLRGNGVLVLRHLLGFTLLGFCCLMDIVPTSPIDSFKKNDKEIKQNSIAQQNVNNDLSKESKSMSAINRKKEKKLP